MASIGLFDIGIAGERGELANRTMVANIDAVRTSPHPSTVDVFNFEAWGE
jgi:hypothetical protein